MQLSVWLIRDCIRNWLNNTFFLRQHLVRMTILKQGFTGCSIRGLSCATLTSTPTANSGIKGPWWNQRTFVVDSVRKALCSTAKLRYNVFIRIWKLFIYWCWCGSWIAYRLYYICVPCSSGSVYSPHSWKNWDLHFCASSESFINEGSFIQIGSAIRS